MLTVTLYQRHTVGNATVGGHLCFINISLSLQNDADCNTLSTTYSWECYCTPFWGCQHKNFRITPEVKTSTGLHLGLDKGVHDSDYIIEIIATNKANLITTSQTKVINKLMFIFPSLVYSVVLIFSYMYTTVKLVLTDTSI